MKRTLAKGAYSITQFFGISPLSGTRPEGEDDEAFNAREASRKKALEDVPYWMKDDYFMQTGAIAAPSAPSFDDVPSSPALPQVPQEPTFDAGRIEAIQKQQQEQLESENARKAQQEAADAELAKKLAAQMDLEETPPPYSPPTAVAEVSPSSKQEEDKPKRPVSMSLAGVRPEEDDPKDNYDLVAALSAMPAVPSHQIQAIQAREPNAPSGDIDPRFFNKADPSLAKSQPAARPKSQKVDQDDADRLVMSAGAKQNARPKSMRPNESKQQQAGGGAGGPITRGTLRGRARGRGRGRGRATRGGKAGGADRVVKAPKIPQEHRPYFIILVSLVHVIVLIYELVYYGGFAPFLSNPWLGPDRRTLVDLGAKYAPFLVKVGRSLEKSYGVLRVAPIYILSGGFGNIISAIFIPTQISCGASGALFGFLGVLLTDLLQNWKQLQAPMRNLFTLVVVIVIAFLIGLLPGVDNFAHLGGFVMGIITGFIFIPNLSYGKCQARWRTFAVCTFMPLVVFMFLGGVAIFYFQVDAAEWCDNCKVINCIPVLEELNWCDTELF